MSAALWLPCMSLARNIVITKLVIYGSQRCNALCVNMQLSFLLLLLSVWMLLLLLLQPALLLLLCSVDSSAEACVAADAASGTDYQHSKCGRCAEYRYLSCVEKHDEWAPPRQRQPQLQPLQRAAAAAFAYGFRDCCTTQQPLQPISLYTLHVTSHRSLLMLCTPLSSLFLQGVRGSAVVRKQQNEEGTKSTLRSKTTPTKRTIGLHTHNCKQQQLQSRNDKHVRRMR